MLETTITRHNPLVDPQLAVWGWEIPVYLFAGGVVAGMMILSGVAMLRVARGDDPRTFFSLHTPLLAFVLINLGMGALFLDLAHKLYVWRVYVTFQPGSPMSWGSWVLLAVYAVLLASALVRLPQAWPWLGRRVRALQPLSDAITGDPARMRALAWANVVLGVVLGIYTGILLNTMVARPLWNTAMLGPLFLVSGLSAGAAAMHVASVFLPRRPAPKGMLAGAISALVQQLGPAPPERRAVDALIRADLAFLAVELVLLLLLIANLQTSSASHAAAAALLVGGPYAWAFWGLIVALGILAPLALQGLELRRRIPHTVVPALLVLVGGLTLRWVMVNAGQASHVVRAAGL
jgi:formate-dependent nitrite reductase membrane component NrfD